MLHHQWLARKQGHAAGLWVQFQYRGSLTLGPSVHTPFILQVSVLVLELLNKLVPVKQSELFFLMQAKPD